MSASSSMAIGSQPLVNQENIAKTLFALSSNTASLVHRTMDLQQRVHTYVSSLNTHYPNPSIEMGLRESLNQLEEDFYSARNWLSAACDYLYINSNDPAVSELRKIAFFAADYFNRYHMPISIEISQMRGFLARQSLEILDPPISFSQPIAHPLFERTDTSIGHPELEIGSSSTPPLASESSSSSSSMPSLPSVSSESSSSSESSTSATPTRRRGALSFLKNTMSKLSFR